MRILVSGLFMSFLAAVLTTGFGCASSGSNYNEAKVGEIQKGVTTEAQLVEMFGEPQNRTINSDGTSRLMWNYNEAQADKRMFIPVAGGFFAGNSAHKNKFLHVTLRNGVVETYSSTSGGTETRGNIQEVPQ